MNSNTYPIRKLTLEEYPELVKQAGHPPKELYIRGELPSAENIFLTVVGTREFTDYGAMVCRKLIARLRGYPVVIVSGLAYGIDSIAHEAALENGLKTIGMPGSGLADKSLYPSASIELAHNILRSGGCLISPFFETITGFRWTFPVRNRVMAGMSHATLVIEADVESGTLITSKWATELNRDVLAVPGRIFDPKSAGPHQLIRSGAVPITCPDDLIEALHLKPNAKRNNIDYSKLSSDELKIVSLLANPMTRDALADKAGMETSQLSTVISMLELRGIIEESLGELRRV